jgi:tetratricopeptide (TPR) repeat protein
LVACAEIFAGRCDCGELVEVVAGMIRYFLPLCLLLIGNCFCQTSSQAVAPTTSSPSTAEAWLKEGQEQYKAGQYSEARRSFEAAGQLDGKNIEAKLGLANACIKLWVGGGHSLASEDNYFRARNTLLNVLDQQPDNKKALTALSRLSLQRASSGGEMRPEGFDEAREWNLRLIAIDPHAWGAHYALGVIAWTRCVGPESQSRNPQNMQPSNPDVPPEVQARLNYRAVCQGPIEEGIWHLKKALEEDKDNSAFMGYLGALYDMKAGYEDSAERAGQDRATSQEWTAKAEAAKKSRAEAGNSSPPNQ